MTPRIVKNDEAGRDLLEQFVRIGLESTQVAARFLENAERTFEFIARNPGFGALSPARSKRLAGLRRWPVQGFPKHIVFYRPVRGGVEIVRVLHGARDLPRILGLDKS